MDRLPPDVAEVVAELRKGLEEFYGTRFRDLLLYGSYARGDQRQGSDVDLLVLLDGPVDTGREILRLESITWPLFLGQGVVLSVMPVSYEAYQKGETSFLRIVRKEAMQAAQTRQRSHRKVKRYAERRGLTGVVAEVAGVLKGAEIGDPREEYTEYLRKKYS